MERAWPRVRAALLTFVIVVGLVAGLPFPADHELYRVPAWYARLVPSLRRTQELALTPFRPIADALVLVQRWNLFSGAKTQRYWLSLEGREAATRHFVVLYRPHDLEHDTDASALEYRRVRGAWNPRGHEPPRGYDAFVAFEARRLFTERADLDVVRARIENIELLPRGGGFRPSGRYVFELVRRRSQVLP
jgi:hypothetical protein